jgi:hypothetical protein
MKLEELIKNFQSQEIQIKTAIREGEEQLTLLKEHLLKVQGAIEGLRLASENLDLFPTEEEIIDGKDQVLSE